MPDKIQNKIAAQPENCAKQKKIYLVIGIVILLIACAAIAAVCFWPKKFSQNKPLGYYQELGNKCHNNGCCLASVNTMSDGKFKLEPEAGCPADYKSNMPLCVQSYKWCEPVKNAEATSTEANINIADWQTYRNEEYGFDMKIPQDWIAITPESSNFIRLESPNQQKEYVAYFSFDSLRLHIEESELKPETINNIDWKWFRTNFEEDELLTFRTQHNNHTYEFEFYVLYERELRQILSSFKFIE